MYVRRTQTSINLVQQLFYVIHQHTLNSRHGTGLWGGLNKDLQLMRRLRDTMFNRTAIVRKSLDQKLLRAIVWPEIKVRASSRMEFWEEYFTLNIYFGGLRFWWARGGIYKVS